MTGNKMLKGGDERPLWYGGVLSHPRRLGASSLPLEPRLSALPFGGVYGALIDRLTCVGASQGPLVRFSICACVKMVAKTEMRMLVLGK